jgi:molybdopterin/thiamine biosynthesis adenylyltransferase
MLVVRPKLHDLVGSGASRTVAQLTELRVEPSDRQVNIGLVLPQRQDAARRLLAETLIDMLVRLDPLVGAVIVDASASIGESVVSDLALRFPLETEDRVVAPDYTIAVGERTPGADLVVDGVGWLAAIGSTIDQRDNGNPVGPLSGATFAAAEVFKWAFREIYSERAGTLQLNPWSGVFSLFSYDEDESDPAITNIRIDATLIGLGGVGAGFIRTMAALGDRVSGLLNLVDADVLTTHNLNRVSYASLAGAISGALKVDEAVRLLKRCCPRLSVMPYPMKFDRYKRQIARREDRRYDVVVTGLDNDETRWEVQRDLPRILIDGATGRHMNARVERVEFGRYGCLGCSRRTPEAPADEVTECDAPPDGLAPSLSFLSSFPGILAAGEVIKEAMGSGQLQGSFDHIFGYGPNADLQATPGFRDDCTVGCHKASRLQQYWTKYPAMSADQPDSSPIDDP